MNREWGHLVCPTKTPWLSSFSPLGADRFDSKAFGMYLLGVTLIAAALWSVWGLAIGNATKSKFGYKGIAEPLSAEVEG